MLAGVALLGGCAYPAPYAVYEDRPVVAQRTELAGAAPPSLAGAGGGGGRVGNGERVAGAWRLR